MTSPFHPASPYASTRHPVFARNVVATSHPLAAQVGLRTLQQGGNAIDAAIATAAAMTVLEPCSNGLGSDAFAIVWDGQKLHGLNASGRAPAARAKRDNSAKPRAISAARVFEPNPSPCTTPAAIAITFFSAAANSTPTGSVFE